MTPPSGCQTPDSVDFLILNVHVGAGTQASQSVYATRNQLYVPRIILYDQRWTVLPGSGSTLSWHGSSSERRSVRIHFSGKYLRMYCFKFLDYRYVGNFNFCLCRMLNGCCSHTQTCATSGWPSIVVPFNVRCGHEALAYHSLLF